MDIFDTVNLIDASMYRGNVITNWSLDLSYAMLEGDILPLTIRWYSVPGQDAPTTLGSLPIARRRDGLCVIMADGEDVLQPSMVTVNNELALLCVGDGLMNCNCLAWVSRIANSPPTQAISVHRMFSMLVGDGISRIDMEAEVCRLIGFDPATYVLVNELAANSAREIPKERQFKLIIS